MTIMTRQASRIQRPSEPETCRTRQAKLVAIQSIADQSRTKTKTKRIAAIRAIADQSRTKRSSLSALNINLGTKRSTLSALNMNLGPARKKPRRQAMDTAIVAIERGTSLNAAKSPRKTKRIAAIRACSNKCARKAKTKAIAAIRSCSSTKISTSSALSIISGPARKNAAKSARKTKRIAAIRACSNRCARKAKIKAIAAIRACSNRSEAIQANIQARSRSAAADSKAPAAKTTAAKKKCSPADKKASTAKKRGRTAAKKKRSDRAAPTRKQRPRKAKKSITDPPGMGADPATATTLATTPTQSNPASVTTNSRLVNELANHNKVSLTAEEAPDWGPTITKFLEDLGENGKEFMVVNGKLDSSHKAMFPVYKAALDKLGSDRGWKLIKATMTAGAQFESINPVPPELPPPSFSFAEFEPFWTRFFEQKIATQFLPCALSTFKEMDDKIVAEPTSIETITMVYRQCLHQFHGCDVVSSVEYIVPKDFFREAHGDQYGDEYWYSEFDETTGLPTKFANGEPLSEMDHEKAVDALAKYTKVYKAKIGITPEFEQCFASYFDQKAALQKYEANGSLGQWIDSTVEVVQSHNLPQDALTCCFYPMLLANPNFLL